MASFWSIAAFVWRILVVISKFLEGHLGAITAVIAVAAILQWRETRKTAERQLRAYVSFKPGNATLREGNKPSVEAIMINSGQTPAYDLRTISWGDVFEVGRVDTLSAVEPDDDLRPAMVVPPNGGDFRLLVEGATPITSEVMKSIRLGTHAFFAVGLAVYWDTFKERERRSTFVFKMGKEELAAGTVSYWHSGNGSD